ncbi:MAG: FAD-dependent oxidoreductase, partial [Bacteroidales bacterium]|nr:FAD-dependent oxidoreductase [Bacteroidales bacterium]
MSNYHKIFIVFLSLLLLVSCQNQHHRADIIVYGGTSAGVAAAVEASRLGLSVILVCPDKHLGGLSSSGLGWTDSGNKEVIGGLAREVYQRIKSIYDEPESWMFEKAESCRHYKPDQDAVWVFEPHVAEEVFEQLIDEENIPVYRDHWLDRKNGVKTKNGNIQSARMLNGEVFKAKVFIDASYEGDLMASAGVSYTVGRESNTQYGETLNGVNTKQARYHQFEMNVDPYIIPGHPESGLLPGIHDGGPGEEGAGDKRIQAYCYRMCLTKVQKNMVPFPKPDSYDPLRYELLARYLDVGKRNLFGKFDPIPNRKTDTNNSGAFSTDNIGMNYDYPEGIYEERAAIIKEHENYQQGLMWFMANDPRVPE